MPDQIFHDRQQIDPHFALLGTELYMQQNFNTIWLQKYGGKSKNMLQIKQGDILKPGATNNVP